MSAVALKAGRRSVEISNPDKVLFGDDGITKADLASYYGGIAETMLPYVRERPAHLDRYPDGIDAERIVQKNVPGYFPDWVDTVRVRKKGGTVNHPVCSDAATLVYLANQATITPHVWLSRVDDLEHPDLLIWDLDPPRDDLELLRGAARLLRELLEEIGLAPFLKTTGSRGFHLVVPLDRSAPFDEVRELARDVSRVAVERDPDRLTVEMRKRNRGDRLFVDWLRNAYAQTAVPPYAVRARPGAPVATPIEWDELGSVDSRSFTIANVHRRLSRKGDPWRGLRRHARSLSRPRKRLDRLLAAGGGGR
jgi:bifunctional non-homologous end joining protein LigD